MKRDSEVATFVGHAMETEFVCHVRHLVLLVRLLGDDLHWAITLGNFWKLVPSLREVAAQDLHEAMSIAMIMDRAALARGPDENELLRLD